MYEDLCDDSTGMFVTVGMFGDVLSVKVCNHTFQTSPTNLRFDGYIQTSLYKSKICQSGMFAKSGMFGYKSKICN